MKGRDKHSVRKCRTVKQFEKAVRKQGGNRTEGSNHPHFNHPDGGSAPFSDHKGDMGGSRFTLIRLLLGLGFVCFTPICLLVWLANGLSSMY